MITTETSFILETHGKNLDTDSKVYSYILNLLKKRKSITVLDIYTKKIDNLDKKELGK